MIILPENNFSCEPPKNELGVSSQTAVLKSGLIVLVYFLFQLCSGCSTLSGFMIDVNVL